MRVKVFPDSFQLASFFSKAGRILNDEYCIHRGHEIRAELAKQDQILAPHIKSIAVAQRRTDIDSTTLAEQYEQIGLTHISLDGHGKQAIDNCLEALRLRENDPNTTKEQLAWSLFYVGLAYQRRHGEQGYWVTNISDSLMLADDYHRRALSIWNDFPPYGVEAINVADDKRNYVFETAYSQMLLDYGYRHFPEIHEHDDKILYWLQVEASLENVAAMLSLARRYRDGLGCIKDLERSYYWASMAVAVQTKHDIERHIPEETDNYIDSKKDEVDETIYEHDEIIMTVQSAGYSPWAKHHHIHGARVFLASQIINGTYYTPSAEEKTYWICYAAEAGDLRYMLRYAMCLRNGTACKEDLNESFMWLCRIANIVGVNKSNELTYRHGDSWPRDLEDIRNENQQILEKTHQVVLHNFDKTHIKKWYHCAVTAGNLEYVDNMGALLLSESSCAEDYRKAFLLFQQLSEKGSVMADYYLGWMYINGFADGNVQDIDKGMSLYESSVYCNYCDKACLALAKIYFGLDPKTAHIVQQDSSQALLFCSFAASFRKEASNNGQTYEVHDIIQLIEAWEAASPNKDWDGNLYFQLYSFYTDHAFETHRSKVEEYLAKSIELNAHLATGTKLNVPDSKEEPTEEEHKMDDEIATRQVDPELDKIIDAIARDLEISFIHQELKKNDKHLYDGIKVEFVSD